MRDIAYEQAMIQKQRRMLRILDEYNGENSADWNERDFLAIQRALQIYIESFIGLARYFVQQKYNLPVARSREALDELKSREQLSRQQYEKVLKIIAFRNVLAHDYLQIDDRIVEAVVVKREYSVIEELILKWYQVLESMP